MNGTRAQKLELMLSLMKLFPPEKHAELAELIKNIESLIDAVVEQKTDS